jgi:TolB-like protein
MQVTARILGLEVLVEGAVQQSGVTVRLVDVHTAKLIWADNYPLGETAQTARAIASHVGAHLILVGQFPRSH